MKPINFPAELVESVIDYLMLFPKYTGMSNAKVWKAFKTKFEAGDQKAYRVLSFVLAVRMTDTD